MPTSPRSRTQSVEASPRLEVRQILVVGEAVQQLEVAPVLQHHGGAADPGLVAEAPQLGVLVENARIFGMAAATGHRRWILSGLLIRIPMRKTTNSPSISR